MQIIPPLAAIFEANAFGVKCIKHCQNTQRIQDIEIVAPVIVADEINSCWNDNLCLLIRDPWISNDEQKFRYSASLIGQNQISKEASRWK